MERVYMIPAKAYKKLSLPSTQSPTVALDKSLQELNTQTKLPDAARWNEYERILNAFFAHQKKPYMTASSSAQPEDNVLQPLFPEANEESIQRIILPIYQTLPKTLKEKGMQLL